MKTICLTVVSIVALCLNGCARQEAPTSVKPLSDARIVRSSRDVVTLVEPRITVAAGTSDNLVVPISIANGYHVNANPATFDYLIATELSAAKTDGITVGKPVYPQSISKQFQFAEKPLAVYEGDAQIKLPLQVAANAAKGKQSLALRLRVQACDEEKCFPPDTLQVAGAVDVR